MGKGLNHFVNIDMLKRDSIIVDAGAARVVLSIR